MKVRNSERARIAPEAADHAARDHRDAALVHAAGSHALVRRIHHHADAARLEDLRDAVGDLRGELLLHLQAPRVAIHHPGELADADDLVGGQVTDVHASDHRRDVVLTMRLEGDVAQHDHLVVSGDLLEGAAQVGRGVDLIAGEPVAIRIDHPLRRVAQPFARRVIARPAQQGAYRILCRAARNLRSLPRHARLSGCMTPFEGAGRGSLGVQCAKCSSVSVSVRLQTPTRLATTNPAASGRQPMRHMSVKETESPTAVMPQVRKRSEAV